MKVALTEKQEFEVAKKTVERQIQRALDYDVPCAFPSIDAFIETWKEQHPDSFLNRKEA